MEEEDEQMQKLMAVPSELLAQMVQSNTDLTRCVTRLMEYLPTIQPPPPPPPPPPPLPLPSPPDEDDVTYHDVSIFGTIVNMLVIAALFFWFLDIFRM
jgi:hypothetical protein